jgi:hypothetical protein
MEAGIQRDGAMQIIPGLFVVTEALVYHARVEKEQSVFRVQAQRFLHRGGRFIGPVIPVQRPGQSIPCVNIVPNLKLFARQLQSLFRMNIVIRVKNGQLAVVYDPVESVEPADVLDKVELFFRFDRISGFRVKLEEE